MNSCTYIILAAFNGAEFLAAQLDSILAQTETGWKLLIRDDGSTDATLEIIQDYCQKDERIFLLVDSGDGIVVRSSSALTNFSILLEAAFDEGAEYLFCCDQDDVWKREKLSIMLARLKQLEGQGKSPSLVHHDLAVVDQELQTVSASFIGSMHLHPHDQHNPFRLVSRNEVTGCALACNRALLEIALPISNQAVMHDWWLALCAGFFGRLEYCPDLLVQYRQHDHNTIGAKSFWQGLNPFTNWYLGWKRGNEEFIGTVRQAKAFQTVMAERLGKGTEVYAMLELYKGLTKATRWRRLKALQVCNLWRPHWILNVAVVLRMLLLPKKLV